MYKHLPKAAQKQADNAFSRLEENPSHPSLHFKKVGKYWSARININFRAVAVKSNEDFIWFWIGSHADYDKLID